MEKKIETAIKLLKAFAKNDLVEICYSGGKDSEVILELAKMAEINYRAIYKNTTIDPPGTIEHCRRKGVEIVRPKKNFFQIVREQGMPHRAARFCCKFLKEYKILDKAVQGVRVAESARRKHFYSVDDPIICRIYGAKKNNVQVCLPILGWSDEDVAKFIELRQIQCHPLYYDAQGNFIVKNRLGCIACPLRGDRGVGQLKERPKFFLQLVKNVQIWWETHKLERTKQLFASPYDLIARNLFFDTTDQFISVDNSLFGKVDWKKELENYFTLQLP